jgi:hypothetical protein
MMDEVDVLLHPLKSELNFPIGAKDPIDLSGDRWELPIHLAEAIFSIDHQNREIEADDVSQKRQEMKADLDHLREPKLSVWKLAEIRSEVNYKDMLATIGGALQSGKDNHKLQSIPHLVLLDPSYYTNELQVLIARWSLLWLHRALSEDLTMCMTNITIEAYIAGNMEADLDRLSEVQLAQRCAEAGISEQVADTELARTISSSQGRKARVQALKDHVTTQHEMAKQELLQSVEVIVSYITTVSQV